MIKAPVLLLLLITALLAIPCTVYSDDAAICTFAGTVTLDGSEVVDGTVIKAIIGNDEYITTTPTGYGPSTYRITIQPSNEQHYGDGTEVAFTIDRYLAEQTGLIQAGETIRLDLSAFTSGGRQPMPPSDTEYSDDQSNPPSLGLVFGLVLACIVEVSMVAGVAYITIQEWNA
ncbi:MAG: hypothetical protein JSV02_01810 [Dehalococcoidia bacterium]|nr:MAG: hypothetical protein JSV02_01810 [Dehalococcoidia bacterium]